MVDILGGIKLAGGGELGFGVGEEEWGSGEREVLEDFVSRTEGLADVVVSRFGNASPAKAENNRTKKSGEIARDKCSWVGCDSCPATHDGVVFSGVNALSRSSLMQVSHWMEWIYRYGKDAYGVSEDPTSARRRKRRRASADGKRHRGRSDSKGREPSTLNSPSNRGLSPGIPPPLVGGANHHRANSTRPDPEASNNATPRASTSGSKLDSAGPPTDTFMKILTLGYGSTWGSSSKSQHSRTEGSQPQRSHDAGHDEDYGAQPQQSEGNPVKGPNIPPLDESPGYFILGLRDDPEHDDSDEEDGAEQGRERRGSERNKILLRTLHVGTPADKSSMANDGMVASPLVSVICSNREFHARLCYRERL